MARSALRRSGRHAARGRCWCRCRARSEPGPHLPGRARGTYGRSHDGGVPGPGRSCCYGNAQRRARYAGAAAGRNPSTARCASHTAADADAPTGDHRTGPAADAPGALEAAGVGELQPGCFGSVLALTATEYIDVAQMMPADWRETGQAALDLARAGWPIIPLNTDKQPRWPRCDNCVAQACTGIESHAGFDPAAPCTGPCHAVRSATTDPATLLRWWGRCEPHMFGIAVPRGVLVLDVDCPSEFKPDRPDGFAALAGFPALPETLSVVTPSGGRHHYFACPPGARLRDKLTPGIDVKHHGPQHPSGYVAAPPSGPGGGLPPYRWVNLSVPIAAAPAWLIGALRPAAAPRGAGRTDWTGATFGEMAAAAAGDGGPSEPFHLTWAEILCPHGWKQVSGAEFRHPRATQATSAKVGTSGRLRVWSPNAFPFETGRDYTPSEAHSLLAENTENVGE